MMMRSVFCRGRRSARPMGLILVSLAALLAMTAATAAAAEKYSGPRPSKPDVPYILHADKLVETEVNQASQGSEKKSTVYTVPGATSPARTPLPEPIFIFQSNKLNSDRLSLYKMTVKNGARVLSLPERGGKNGPRAIYLMVKPLESGLFKVETNEFIDDGEYCLSPDGSNEVFCFTTY